MRRMRLTTNPCSPLFCCAQVRAHKSTLSCMVGCGNTCVTASILGTIRMW